MIKKGNNKKKKGFTLIELVIVLAVMAIIALIAIPNFAAVRNNSKVKADQQSCATIERTMLMLVSDETIKGSGEITVSFDGDGKNPTSKITKDGILASEGENDAAKKATAETDITEALKDVKAPQAAPDFKKDGDKANAYKIIIDTDGKVTATTTATTTPED